MTKAFITGVTGCLGSNLAAELLKSGVEVVGLCQPGAPTLAIASLKVTRVVADINDGPALASALRGVDWVFHAAAIADDWRHPAQRIYRVNTDGTQTVLNAALAAGVSKFVLTSSAASLGVPRPGRALLDEDCEFNLQPWQWVYAHSKLLAEQHLQRAVRQGLPAVSILPTAILGPGDLNFISGQIIRRACRGEVFPFPHGGVNFVDVRDVAQAHLQAALYGLPGQRYLVGGHNLSHLHCLGTLADVLSLPVRHIQLPGWLVPALAEGMWGLQRLGVRTPIDRQRILLSRETMYYNNARAVQALGLRPRPFEITVEDAYRWYVDHGLLPARVRPAAVCTVPHMVGE